MLVEQENANKLWAKYVAENWNSWCTRADNTFFKITIKPKTEEKPVNKYLQYAPKTLQVLIVTCLGLGLFQWQFAALSVLLSGVYLGLPQTKAKFNKKKEAYPSYFLLKNGQFGANGGWKKQYLSQVLNDNPTATVEEIKHLIELAVQKQELKIEEEQERFMQAQSQIINSNAQSEESVNRAARIRAKRELQKSGIWGL